MAVHPDGVIAQRTRISDVATRAGVSIKTVSRVLNDEPTVRPSTRERVLRVMRELDYVPDIHARRLAGRRLHVIGLVVPQLASIYNSYLYDIVRGVVDQTETTGYQAGILLGREQRAPADEYVRFLREGRADGLIVIPRPENLGQITELAAAGLPAVAIDDGLLRPAIPTVTVDNYGGARLAVDHLIRHGHQRIAHVAGRSVFGCTREREAGYLTALRDAGLSREARVVCGDYLRSAGFLAAEELFGSERPPTAIFCANDEMALGALGAAQRRGLVAGRDVAIVGFDDTQAARDASPPLTTVHQPLYDLGRRAIQKLVDRLHGGAHAVAEEVLSCRLVVRGSCGDGASHPPTPTPSQTERGVEASGD